MLYGCDSNSDHFPCGSADFYIGRLGYGTTKDLSVFNSSTAATVRWNNTFGYWFVQGPNDASPPATTDTEAYSWGQSQASAAASAWATTQGVCRSIIFADIEGNPVLGTNGWGTNTSLNQKVWEGFYNQLAADPHKFLVGLYSTSEQWDAIMGSGYGVPSGTTVWSADLTNSNGSNGPEPCGGCPTSFPSNLGTIGGIAPTIWQYNQNTGQPPTCADDLDAALSLPI